MRCGSAAQSGEVRDGGIKGNEKLTQHECRSAGEPESLRKYPLLVQSIPDREPEMEGKRGYEKLQIWQRSHELAKKVYALTADFPKSEIYGLTAQLRRSSLSVPTNIVEGYARRSKKEFSNFLNIAYGSLSETEYLLRFSFDNNFLNVEEYERMSGEAREIASMIWVFMKRI